MGAAGGCRGMSAHISDATTRRSNNAQKANAELKAKTAAEEALSRAAMVQRQQAQLESLLQEQETLKARLAAAELVRHRSCRVGLLAVGGLFAGSGG